MVVVGPATSRSQRSLGLPSRRQRRRRRLLIGLGVVVLALLGAAAAVWHWSGATLAADPVALARVDVQPFGGKLVGAQAFGADGRRIPLAVAGGRLTPGIRLDQGERVSVDVVVRRPGWSAWALGKERHERLSLTTPSAHVTDLWPTIPSGSTLRVRFDMPVSAVAWGIHGRRTLARPTRALAVGKRLGAGAIAVAGAPRTWERLAKREVVNWFPRSPAPVVVVRPAPRSSISPVAPIRLTFAQPVSAVLGSARPTLSPSTPGRWSDVDDHTIEFRPTGVGAGLDTNVRLALPKRLAATGPAGRAVQVTRTVGWTVPGGSFLRLEQLLADAGYLPLTWTPKGEPVARTPEGELAAAIDPPAGSFSWRYGGTPPELQSLWREGEPNTIVRGAVMMFQDEHELAVDGVAGPRVWAALVQDAIDGKQHTGGYNYVFVHRNVPQSLNLWHAGGVILTSPGNTGVPAAPTQLGTFPVFEHIPVGTMSGTNPDGSKYHDPGIRWISYFNGGDALHAFNRASFGTPQSLGCVELPLAEAAKVWPYTPIGTLVTIEN